MQKPARAYGMTKVEYQHRVAAYEAALEPRTPREGLFTRLFKRS